MLAIPTLHPPSCFFFSSRSRHTRLQGGWSSDVCSSDLAVAQWAGMPVWNNPKGGTGVTIDGDLGLPNSNGGKGTAFGARATLGIANISLTAGLSSWKPSGAASSTTSVGGTAQFKVIGGSLIPVAVNFQLGAGTSSAV